MTAGDDPEATGFLHRWARLKRTGGDPAEGDEATEDAVPGALGPDENAAGREAVQPIDPEHGPEPKPEPEPEPDPDLIASLPRIEDITADTDVTAFLRSGVPRALRNAALRRAWAADPRIANYLDPARDYFWDWNAPAGMPGGIPGGGGTLGAEAVAKMVRAVVGLVQEADAVAPAPSPGPTPATGPTPVVASPAPVPARNPSEGAAPEPTGKNAPGAVFSDPEPGPTPGADRAAAKSTLQGAPTVSPTPRHGGAMPS